MLIDASLTPGVTGAGSSPLPPDPSNLGPSSSAALVAVLPVPASTLPPWSSSVAVSALAATPTSAFSTAPSSVSVAALLSQDVEFKDDDNETVVLCVICQDPLVDDNAEVKVLPCGHNFHAACVRCWWDAYPYHARCCAICKQPATFENTTNDEEDIEVLQ